MVFQNAWDVFLLFLIPIGGGIPAGVLLARTYAIAWPWMMLIYFASDCVLACVFEPVARWLLRTLRNPHLGARMRFALERVMTGSALKNGIAPPGPFALVMISFGVDPMTGRTAALAVGHGFFAGWAIAIAGDMIFFAVIMASTLWLNGVLGDGTWTAVIIMSAMIVVPWGVRRLRARYARKSATPL